MLEVANQSGSAHRNPNYHYQTLLLAFKPRQVVLKTQRLHTATTMKHCGSNKKKKLALNLDQKALLLQSVLRYLQLNGFSRALKRLLSEAEIENDNWKICSLDLEDMYANYLETCTLAETRLDSYKEQEVITDGISMKCRDSHHSALEQTVKKKKKKKTKNDEGNDNAAANQSGTADIIADSTMNSGEILANKVLADSNVKEKKSSKKRKRSASDENEGQLTSKESKSRKTKPLEEANSCEQLKKVNGNTGGNEYSGKESKGENCDVGHSEFQNTSVKQPDVHTNGDLGKNGEKSAAHKSRRKQHEGLAEPKTVNAFQRVKLDEVEFADERLQDNSYWAKLGAEVGYGAKAQEILGQVRGRDFRHEKTKKKRGSYRGGQIDLQTHSIKFNYSDED